MRTRRLFTLVAAASLSLGASGQTMKYMDVHWPKEGSIYAPGDTFHLKWDGMDKLNWDVELEYYKLKLHNPDPAQRPKYKTHDNLPHDFMYNHTLVYKEVEKLNFKHSSSNEELVISIPCETTWLWAGKNDIQQTGLASTFNNYVNMNGLLTGSNPLNSITTPSFPDLHKMVIKGARSHVPGFENQHFYFEVFFIDNDPNPAPEHLNNGFEVLCGGQGNEICISSTRQHMVYPNYSYYSQRIQEDRLIKFFRVPDHLNNLSNQNPEDLFFNLSNDLTEDPEENLIFLEEANSDFCLDDYSMPENRYYDVLAVRAYREYAVGGCANQVKDRSAIQPIVVFDFSKIAKDFLINRFTNLLQDGEVYSDQELVCDDQFDCALPTTYYPLAGVRDFQQPQTPLNGLIGNMTMKVKSVQWEADWSSYNGWTPSSPNEDFLTHEYYPNGDYKRSKVCWTDLENAYHNIDNLREMTYSGLIELEFNYEGQTFTCTYPVTQRVTQNPQTATIVIQINKTIQAIQDAVPVALSADFLCEELYGYYINIIDLIDNNTPLRHGALESLEIASSTITETPFLHTHSGAELYLNEAVAKLYDESLKSLGLRIEWDPHPALQDRASFFPKIQPTTQPTTLNYSIYMEGRNTRIPGSIKIVHSEPFTVFPNPANTSLTVQGKQIQDIAILDLSGKTVSIESTHHKESSTLDVSLLPIGMYFIQVRKSDGTLETKKIMINR